MSEELATAEDVIVELGGVPCLAELMGADYKAAYAWKLAGKFPSKTFLAMTRELERRGKSAPAALWSMVEPERAPS